MRAVGSTSAACLALLAACSASDADSGGPAELPPADTSWQRDTGTFPIDTAGDSGDPDEAPEHVLVHTELGAWALGGPSQDPTSMTGGVDIVETIDGGTTCAERWALVGARAEVDCPGCTFTFSVEHTLVSSDAGACRAAELPTDGETRSLGYDGDTVWWDWYDTGVWVPVWAAEEGELPSELLVQWEWTAGVVLEDEP